MNIKVFGQLVDVIGKENVEIYSTTINTLKNELISNFPELEKYTYQISINHEIEFDDKELGKDDEIALLPPFAGGQLPHLHQGPIPKEIISSIYDENLNADSNGAHAIFLGQVRADKFSDQNVNGIDYSAYAEMAEKQIKKVIDENAPRFGFSEIIIYHSVGFVKAGEVSLLVWIKSKHRQNTFEGLKEIVEQIKFNVPIWKKEKFKDGSHRWIEERKPS